MSRIRRPLVLGVAFTVALTACTSSTAPTTEATIRSAVDAAQTTTTSSTTTSSTTTTTLIPTGPPLISEGDNNEMVEAFQFLLTCTGYGDLTIDGAFGPGTLEAVEAAQTALGRQVTGAPDDETFAELSRACPETRELENDEGTYTVAGNAAPQDPAVFEVTLPAGTALSTEITLGAGLTVSVRGTDNTEVTTEDEGATWIIEDTGNYFIEVSVAGGADPDTDTDTDTDTEGAEPEEGGGAATFTLEVGIAKVGLETGEWILATDGLTYDGTELGLGDDADTVIDNIFDFLGHGVRGAYEEFDTDWYTIDDPQSLGLRGIFIEGLAFLFFGPHPGEPDRAETLERIRFEGPSDDAEGNPRPDNYVTTAEGITVGDTLADLEAAYVDVDAGSNDDEYYYRYSDSGGELCFDFGSSEPDDDDEIIEIATECRS